MKNFVKVLLPAAAALVACQAGFAQVTPHSVVPSVSAGHMRPYAWVKGSTPANLTPNIHPNVALPGFCNTDFFGDGGFWYCPNGLQQVYGTTSIPSGNGGKGTTIAIVDAFHYAGAATDLALFNSIFGLPQMDGIGGDPTLTIVGCTDATSGPPDWGVTCGAPGGASNGGWETEEMLDLEWAHAMAPNANILMVEAFNNGAALYGAVNYAAHHADIVSNSWGSDEFAGENTLDGTFSQAVPILFSSGDSGAAPGAQYPCASPNVTCVGGTRLLSAGSPLHRTTEVAWSGSGGNCSTQEGLPFFQNVGAIGGGGSPSQCAGGTKRAVPDIAAIADPDTGVVLIDQGNFPGEFVQIGGTSLATPVMAGIFSQVIAARATFGEAQIPNLNGPVYAAAVHAYSYFFFDVTSGSNGIPATNGYDLSTGLGVMKGSSAANRFLGLIYNPIILSVRQ
jgi:subtilase family serine protease